MGIFDRLCGGESTETDEGTQNVDEWYYAGFCGRELLLYWKIGTEGGWLKVPDVEKGAARRLGLNINEIELKFIAPENGAEGDNSIGLYFGKKDSTDAFFRIKYKIIETEMQYDTVSTRDIEDLYSTTYERKGRSDLPNEILRQLEVEEKRSTVSAATHYEIDVANEQIFVTNDSGQIAVLPIPIGDVSPPPDDKVHVYVNDVGDIQIMDQRSNQADFYYYDFGVDGTFQRSEKNSFYFDDGLRQPARREMVKAEVKNQIGALDADMWVSFSATGRCYGSFAEIAAAYKEHVTKTEVKTQLGVLSVPEIQTASTIDVDLDLFDQIFDTVLEEDLDFPAFVERVVHLYCWEAHYADFNPSTLGLGNKVQVVLNGYPETWRITDFGLLANGEWKNGQHGSRFTIRYAGLLGDFYYFRISIDDFNNCQYRLMDEPGTWLATLEGEWKPLKNLQQKDFPKYLRGNEEVQPLLYDRFEMKIMSNAEYDSIWSSAEEELERLLNGEMMWEMFQENYDGVIEVGEIVNRYKEEYESIWSSAEKELESLLEQVRAWNWDGASWEVFQRDYDGEIEVEKIVTAYHDLIWPL
jgi:hypothetical protein